MIIIIFENQLLIKNLTTFTNTLFKRVTAHEICIHKF